MEAHQRNATGGDPSEELEEHYSHRAVEGMANDLEVDQEVRRKVVVDMEVGRSLVEDIRNSCCVLTEAQRCLRWKY